ncbi:MAG TPA: hypothetical protein VLI05_06865 [Candidatus Saccharimonadia bacterium]|nr:hypothetical protein [Candidatus Saccharimonadia bacterium]
MGTIAVNLSTCGSDRAPLETVTPFGPVRQAMVDYSIVVGQVTSMIMNAANVGVKLIELTPERIVLFYEYDRSSAFGLEAQLPRVERGDGLDDLCPRLDCHSWLYTFEAGDNRPDLNVLHETVFALAVVNRGICSPQVAAEVAQRFADDSAAESTNLRAALEYYGAPNAWRDRELVSDYADSILLGNPCHIANDALLGRKVESLPEAVARVMRRRARQAAGRVR